MKTIHEVAQLSGITVRTLQYYDKINLLKPTNHTKSGYRLYSADDLYILQKILIYKNLGFSLDDIKKFLFDDLLDEKAKLLQQRVLLLKKKEQLTAMISLVDAFLNGKRDVHFEAFKETLSLNMPIDLSEQQRSKIVPDDFENLQKLLAIYNDNNTHLFTEMEKYHLVNL